MTDKPKRPRGRPPKPIPKLDATPEEVARAIFAAATPPNPDLRKNGAASKERGQ